MVVLIERDNNIRESLIEFFIMLKVEYKATGNMNEGLKLIEKYCPSVLLIDVYFNNEIVQAAIEQCKKYNKECIIILITGMVRSLAESIAKEMNVDHLLIKPFDIDDLESIIKDV